MKKLIGLLLALLTVLSCVALVSCQFGFDKVLKDEIIADHLLYSGIQSDISPEEVEYQYFGKYGNSVAIYFHTSGAYETPAEEEVAGVSFKYPDSRTIKIWNNGKFYKMAEAYDEGLISKYDVIAIKIKSIFLSPQSPYCIFNPKRSPSFSEEYSTYTDFPCTCRGLSVSLDEGISRYNKPFDKAFFVDVDIEDIKVGHVYRKTDQDGVVIWSLSIHIQLVDKSLENHMRAGEMIDNMDGVSSVSIECHGHMGMVPNDELYYDETTSDVTFGQWGLDNIQVTKVWDFTTATIL